MTADFRDLEERFWPLSGIERRFLDTAACSFTNVLRDFFHCPKQQDTQRFGRSFRNVVYVGDTKQLSRIVMQPVA
jgi:hypothetical protein